MAGMSHPPPGRYTFEQALQQSLGAASGGHLWARGQAHRPRWGCRLSDPEDLLQTFTDELAPLPLLTLGFVVMGIASPGALLPSVPAGLSYAAVLLMSLVSGLVPVILFGAAARHAPTPSQVGTTMGMAMQGNNLGLLLGPAAAGAIVQRWDWPWVAAWVCLLGLVALWLIHALRTTRPAAPTRASRRERVGQPTGGNT